ncbi:hypothetical protein K3495_g8453 [Podosphaera aphanis]|nr:hypothetical protein K3495_g8453 [Podosphaera aphanis]
MEGNGFRSRKRPDKKLETCQVGKKRSRGKTQTTPSPRNQECRRNNLFRSSQAEIMAHYFFPQPVAADTRDIDDSIYPEDLPNILEVITETEIKEILQKLPSDKAPGPDGIPNRFLKCCEPSLSRVLAELFNACLTLGYHPKIFKEPTTIVIRKPQKPRYDTPKSYRTIVLLNTMTRLLEKVVANRISKAAKGFNLLPEEQMGARPKRYTISAVEFLTEQIHTIWGKDKKKVASLLSLGISGAFDNVSHKRFIHNLREKGISMSHSKQERLRS